MSNEENNLNNQEKECNCNEHCTCGDNCECTPDNECSPDCTCWENRSTNNQENDNNASNDHYTCGEYIAEDKCSPESDCVVNDNASDCGDNSSYEADCKCDENYNYGDNCECNEDGSSIESERVKTCGCESEETKEEYHCEQEENECSEENSTNEQNAPKDDYLTTLLKLQAEFDNYRKRTENDVSKAYNNGFMDAVVDFLPALDSFKMAKEYITDKNTLVGIQYIEKGILATLEKMGVTEIDATGEFNPELHQAIDTEDAPDVEAGHIVKECYKGFKMGDKVLRYSQVIVKK